MRTQTAVSIAVLAGVFVAVPLYFLSRAEQVATTAPAPAASTTPRIEHPESQKPYCMQRTGSDGVAISSGADCVRQTSGTVQDALSVTTTHEHGAVVITGSDP